jgi:enoyl-CoA hydratase/carnithine racemase
MLLTGDRLPATQALTLGLVDELAAARDLIESAIGLCDRLVPVLLAGEK